MSFAKRCQFAVETVRSLAVPTPEQCTELELMFLERDENEKMIELTRVGDFQLGIRFVAVAVSFSGFLIGVPVSAVADRRS